MIKVAPFLFAFFVLASLVTLYPPYYWGEEKLQPEAQRTSPIFVAGKKTEDVLPIKQRDFLFGNTRKEFHLPVNPYLKTENGGAVTLNRSLILSQMTLEYIAAFFLAGAAQALVTITKALLNRQAKPR